MIKIKVVRPKDTVIVSIMFDRDSSKYRFVNLTHPHICKCKFDTVKDAMIDLDSNISLGSVLSYEIIES